MARTASITLLVLSSLSVCGCSDSRSVRHLPRPHAHFVPTPAAFHAQCRSTARAVGYPVPCPMRVPPAFAANQDGATPGCAITIICPGTGPTLWHGWAFGETSSPNQHLIISAAPRPLDNDAKFVVGPYWRSGMRVRSLAWLTINGRRMHAVFLSQATCMCAFANHVVLVWTVGRHTYGVGFHNFTGLRRTLRLDEELARYVRLVGPMR